MKRSREPDQDIDSDSQADNSVVAISPVTKYTGLDSAIDDKDHHHHDNPEMTCSLPPHTEPLTFTTYNEYEMHYNNFHMNRCLECRKNFPSEHLLGVHIEECHDPLVVIKRDRGEHTYSCFVEGCERKCLTHQKRRMHMIDKHMYPKNFFFAVTKEGIDGRRSLLIEAGHNRRRSSNATQAKDSKRRDSLQGSPKQHEIREGSKSAPSENDGKGEDIHGKPNAEMEELAGAMSSLQFVPQSIRFGRGRAGFSKR